MKAPDYNLGDKVYFYIEDEPVREGVIFVVDAHGTFEQHEEPSYDIMVESENCLYKHIRESLILKEEK